MNDIRKECEKAAGLVNLLIYQSKPAPETDTYTMGRVDMLNDLKELISALINCAAVLDHAIEHEQIDMDSATEPWAREVIVGLMVTARRMNSAK